ncbi:hypothetical protein [Jiangella rhizosphaerae]|uniref:Uncharacterized protein n=1 Tax=Jiangella rhizosphaerae TaxID=2293569 RepID=A0A418KII9_9ACTN|nr:hypothetical protein [Jiangella rhizosphaerae]RIQ13253.1 hypothetical protein DY240_26140 [Jiangella rhizosphaerae]
MQLNLSDDEAEVLCDYLGRRLGDLSMEISHVDNPAYRRILRSERDVLRRLHEVLVAATADGARTTTPG